MGFPILARHIYIESSPRWWCRTSPKCCNVFIGQKNKQTKQHRWKHNIRHSAGVKGQPDKSDIGAKVSISWPVVIHRWDRNVILTKVSALAAHEVVFFNHFQCSQRREMTISCAPSDDYSAKLTFLSGDSDTFVHNLCIRSPVDTCQIVSLP